MEHNRGSDRNTRRLIFFKYSSSTAAVSLIDTPTTNDSALI